MDCEVLTPSGTVFSGTVAEATMFTVNGQIGVLPHHETMSDVIAAGPVVIHVRGQKAQTFDTTGGLVQIENNKIHILIDEPSPDEAEIHHSIVHAAEHADQLRGDAKHNAHIEHASHMIDRQSVRLGVHRLRRHGRH